MHTRPVIDQAVRRAPTWPERVLRYGWLLALVLLGCVFAYAQGYSPDESLPDPGPGRAGSQTLATACLTLIPSLTVAFGAGQRAVTGQLPERSWRWRRAIEGTVVLGLAVIAEALVEPPAAPVIVFVLPTLFRPGPLAAVVVLDLWYGQLTLGDLCLIGAAGVLWVVEAVLVLGGLFVVPLLLLLRIILGISIRGADWITRPRPRPGPSRD